MRTWKRGSIEIVGEILDILEKNSLKKSHIANSCNLDARSLNRYLDVMLNLKLVEKSKDLLHFGITKNGTKFLEKYNALTKFFEKDIEVNEQLEESNPPHLR